MAVYDATKDSKSGTTPWSDRIVIRSAEFEIGANGINTTLANADQVQCIKINAGETVMFAGMVVKTASGNDDAEVRLGYNGGAEIDDALVVNSANVCVPANGDAILFKYHATDNVITVTADNTNALNAGKFDVYAAVMLVGTDRDVPAQS